MTSGEAKRLWRQSIKDHFNNRCVYCGSKDQITLDHIRPRARGGQDVARNLVSACRCCNQAKGTEDVGSWYSQQPFFNMSSWGTILQWAS